MPVLLRKHFFFLKSHLKIYFSSLTFRQRKGRVRWGGREKHPCKRSVTRIQPGYPLVQWAYTLTKEPHQSGLKAVLGAKIYLARHQPTAQSELRTLASRGRARPPSRLPRGRERGRERAAGGLTSAFWRGAWVAFEDMGDKYASLRRAQLHLDFIHANS